MKQFVYRHKETGKYLEICYAGDGEFYSNLVEKITKECIIDENVLKNWPLNEILEADLNGEFDNVDDFEVQEIKMEITLK